MNRNQMLDEMGLSPQWVLRDSTSVLRREKNEAAPERVASKSSAESGPVFSSAVSPAVSSDTSSSKSAISSVPAPGSMRPPGVAVKSSEHAVDRQSSVALMDWNALRAEIADCRACGLCAERKQAVPGVGDENADWLFIGEGPGAEEDARGEPFVGQAGKLLDAMLAAIDLQRGDDVYIANAVKCRPPANRTPEAAEMAACRPYLKRQIALIQPRLIVLLGKAAVHAVLGEEGALASLRGKTLAYRDGEISIPVLVTYHPAYLLRTLPDKAKAWEDLCRARSLMRTFKAPAA